MPVYRFVLALGRVGVGYSDHYPHKSLFQRLMNRLQRIAAAQ
jgi:hypothetical protein